jgi:hypothetical protein
MTFLSKQIDIKTQKDALAATCTAGGGMSDEHGVTTARL